MKSEVFPIYIKTNKKASPSWLCLKTGFGYTKEHYLQLH